MKDTGERCHGTRGPGDGLLGLEDDDQEAVAVTLADLAIRQDL